MTVEERATQLFADIDKAAFYNLTDDAKQWIRDALRDQIEECAKIADNEASIYTKGKEEKDAVFYPSEYREIYNASKRIADSIRDLAAPSEEGKESGR